jgi:cytochrome c peroxidase
MASSWPEVLAKLRTDPKLARRFEQSYGAGPTAASIRDAIASYERSLITPGGPLDRYLCGDDAALTPEQARDYALFKELGCASCHQGRNVGGNMYQRFGFMEDYFAGRTGLSSADLGRFNLTGRDEDRHVFKVPSLRNVQRTAPYFHDGSAPTLELAVRIMGRYQLGRSLSHTEVERLIDFLGTLSGPSP